MIPILVKYESVTLDCGHTASFFKWLKQDVQEAFCRHCGRRRAVAPVATPVTVPDVQLEVSVPERDHSELVRS
jgi:hypothetical protein